MRTIAPNDALLSYSGRIDFGDAAAPTLIWPMSSVTARFRGCALSANLRNHRNYRDNYIGAVIDGGQRAIKLADAGEALYPLTPPLPYGEHTVTLFKRQDGCHYVDFLGFETDGEPLPPPPAPPRRIEFFGDSITCGEVCEADGYTGKMDPPHNGEYSNAYYSYAHLTALALNAEARLTAQGGIALMDGSGFFCAPDLVGVESVWDKTRYNPQLGGMTAYGFDWTPHVVCVALGQNDAHPVNYMARSPKGDKAQTWKTRYKRFVGLLREKYPNALIILKTTIMRHHKNWDAAIDDVCAELNDGKIVRFKYSNNGAGTPGHIRRAEAAQMARELAAFIESFGDGVWG